MADDGFAYVWHVRKTLPEWKGDPCKIEHVIPAKVRVVFADGLTSRRPRWAVEPRPH